MGSVRRKWTWHSNQAYKITFMWRKNRPTQAIPPRVKIWLKSKANFTSRCYCSCRHRCCWCCSVDKDVLQSLPNGSFDRRHKISSVRKREKMCYHNKNNNKVIWFGFGPIFAAENDILYNICVGMMGEKTGTHSYTQARAHTHELEHQIYFMFCFVPKNTSEVRIQHSAMSFTCVSEAKQKWRTFQEMPKQADEAHTMCKLMWFVVLLQAIQTFKTMSLFSSPESLPRSRSTEKHSTLFHLYHAIHLIRFKWFTQKEIIIIRCSTPNTLCYLHSYSINKEKKIG